MSVKKCALQLKAKFLKHYKEPPPLIATSKVNMSWKENARIGCFDVYVDFVPRKICISLRLMRGADHRLETDKLNIMPI